STVESNAITARPERSYATPSPGSPRSDAYDIPPWVEEAIPPEDGIPWDEASDASTSSFRPQAREQAGDRAHKNRENPAMDAARNKVQDASAFTEQIHDASASTSTAPIASAKHAAD